MNIVIGWILWKLDAPVWVWVLFTLVIAFRIFWKFLELEQKHGS